LLAPRIAPSYERLSNLKDTTQDGLLEPMGRNQETKKFVQRITVARGDELRLVTLEEVCCFQADNKYTRVVTPEQESLIRRTIRELLDQLDPNAFWQIHRGTLVNGNAIAGLTRDMGGHLRVRLKQRKELLAVSDPYVHGFKQI
jgi:DNA-binding LytR/AlgR family response regulator